MRLDRWTWVVALGVLGCASTEEARRRDYVNDGVFLYQRGAFAEARQSFQAALYLNPDDPNLLYNLGQCHDRQGESAEAQHYYHRCLQIDPEHAACRHALLEVLVRQGRWPEAQGMVEDWRKRQPASAAALAEAGWLARQAGDREAALRHLQQALELDRHQPRALVELAQLYEQWNHPERSVSLYQRYLVLHPREEQVVQRVEQLRGEGVKLLRPEPLDPPPPPALALPPGQWTPTTSPTTGTGTGRRPE
jgi:Tfp pilus assembly protein PilF